MVLINRLSLVVCFLIVTGMNASVHAGESSKGAKDIPGSKGFIEFTPPDHIPGKTSWWKDSDGVDPGAAGCHIGTDDKGTPNGRSFGEACLPDGLLVESNPGKKELHSHHNDTGHPDTFDCNIWCAAMGKTSGVCVAAPAPPCEQSAYCSCE